MLKFGIENNVIESYKRLSYEPWFAFAEFIDNSTQAFFDNKELQEKFELTGEKLSISIIYDRDADIITIADNSIGMDLLDLDRAMKIGKLPENTDGRSRFGMGMKTAACWFGDKWWVETKKYGDENIYKVEIDVAEIAAIVGEVDLEPVITPGEKELHYTKITIQNLNRKFVAKTLWKIKDYLSSIYRFDISEGIEIKWNNVPLNWIGYQDELHVSSDGIRYKKDFEFEINGKVVEGWVGVLGKGYGSRKKAGFSIIQNKRVIESGYKPTTVYGDQEDGGNDLVNQRVVGELILQKFSVSHTKDKIVWEDDDEDLLDKKLGEVCHDARELALTLRYNREELNKILTFKESSVTILESELKSAEINSFWRAADPYPEKIIGMSYQKSIQNTTSEYEPDLKVEIGDDEDKIKVVVFFSEKSEFDPYVLSETTIEDLKIIVIINVLHPHVQDMQHPESFTNFVRHSIYDGVAEWKALKLRGNIQPNTIKMLKDTLLRIPYEIMANKI